MDDETCIAYMDPQDRMDGWVVHWWLEGSWFEVLYMYLQSKRDLLVGSLRDGKNHDWGFEGGVE